MKRVIFAAAMFVAAGCGFTNRQEADFRGRVFSVREEGVLCRTDEVELITDVGGEHIKVTVDRKDLLEKLKQAQKEQVQVHITYKAPFVVALCSTETGQWVETVELEPAGTPVASAPEGDE